LTFDREVLDSKVIFPVIGQALVERCILLLGDIAGIASPDGFGLVELLVGSLGFFDLLGLLLFLLILIFDLLDLGILAFFDLFLVILDLLRAMIILETKDKLQDRVHEPSQPPW
jgi:hypothetical protein